MSNLFGSVYDAVGSGDHFVPVNKSPSTHTETSCEVGPVKRFKLYLIRVHFCRILTPCQNSTKMTEFNDFPWLKFLIRKWWERFNLVFGSQHLFWSLLWSQNGSKVEPKRRKTAQSSWNVRKLLCCMTVNPQSQIVYSILIFECQDLFQIFRLLTFERNFCIDRKWIAASDRSVEANYRKFLKKTLSLFKFFYIWSVKFFLDFLALSTKSSTFKWNLLDMAIKNCFLPSD